MPWLFTYLLTIAIDPCTLFASGLAILHPLVNCRRPRLNDGDLHLLDECGILKPSLRLAQQATFQTVGIGPVLGLYVHLIIETFVDRIGRP
jgi:hypothetical protein